MKGYNMKIKLIERSSEYNYHDDDYDVIINGITDWDEVNDEQLLEIEAYVKHRNQLGYQVMLVKQIDLPTKKTILEVLEKFKIEEQKKEKVKQDRIAADNKRKATLAKKKKDKEKELYEKLKTKFEA